MPIKVILCRWMFSLDYDIVEMFVRYGISVTYKMCTGTVTLTEDIICFNMRF